MENTIIIIIIANATTIYILQQNDIKKWKTKEETHILLFFKQNVYQNFISWKKEIIIYLRIF